MYQSTYRWLRSGECGSFSDAHHHAFCVIGGRSGFQTKLFLVLWILVRRSGHVPVRHRRRRAHMIHRHLLIVEFFLVIGNVIVLFVIVTVSLFRSEKCVRSSLKRGYAFNVKCVGDLFDRERTLLDAHHHVRHS